MKRALMLPFLLSLIICSTAYEYHMPVNIRPTITPAVLMPGDEAIVAIELENGAAAYGVGKDAGIGSPAQNALLSTPINRTILKGTNEIQVISSDHQDLGMIGPNDKINIYYKIKAGENSSNGTYLLDFGVLGGYDMLQINREIPVKVDSTAVSMARAEIPTKPSVDLNVANPRENTVNAVTIVPSAKGIRFSPDEYYIGTMDPDEIFTISFGIDSDNPAKSIKSPINLSFVSKFKNGDAWHESGAYVTSYFPPKDSSGQKGIILPIGIAALIIVAAGIYLLYRRKRSDKLM
ncbi:MAG: hypothetical protein LUQ38_10605 [Methanotrichaceae archaeon]|nr:hypothetical protein [Methanotrichaceae archaeon]